MTGREDVGGMRSQSWSQESGRGQEEEARSPRLEMTEGPQRKTLTKGRVGAKEMGEKALTWGLGSITLSSPWGL